MQEYIIAARPDKINRFFVFLRKNPDSAPAGRPYWARGGIRMGIRTDLAVEAHALWRRSAGETSTLSGVRAREETERGVPLTFVDILDGEGERALGKPRGHYVTVDLTPLRRRVPDAFSAAADVLAAQLRALAAPEDGQGVLVVGLGNAAVTPDAVGPRALSHLLITRHLVGRLPEAFGALRPVCAVVPGVLGTTGLESAELVRGVIERARPARVIVIDALAAMDPERLCSTVQLSDTGIVPGSGVGNARAAFTRESLGVPTVSIGVPTVIDAAALGAEAASGLIVTPTDIDEAVGELSRLVGTAVNLALFEQLSAEEIAFYVG